jgi:hypothetical protein
MHDNGARITIGDLGRLTAAQRSAWLRARGAADALTRG